MAMQHLGHLDTCPPGHGTWAMGHAAGAGLQTQGGGLKCLALWL